MDEHGLTPSEAPSSGIWRGRDVAIAMALYFAVQVSGGIAVGLAGERAGASLTVITLLLSSLASLGSVGALMAFRRLTWRDVGLTPLTTRWLWLSLGLGLALLFGRQLLAVALAALAPALQMGSDLLAEVLLPNDRASKVAALVLGGIVAPVGEELLFRGVLFDALRRRWAFWPAALAGSLVFGAIHIIPLQVITAALLGLALCWARERSKTLLAPIVIHVINNLVAFILAFIGMGLME